MVYTMRLLFFAAIFSCLSHASEQGSNVSLAQIQNILNQKENVVIVLNNPWVKSIYRNWLIPFFKDAQDTQQYNDITFMYIQDAIGYSEICSIRQFLNESHYCAALYFKNGKEVARHSIYLPDQERPTCFTCNQCITISDEDTLISRDYVFNKLDTLLTQN